MNLKLTKSGVMYCEMLPGVWAKGHNNLRWFADWNENSFRGMVLSYFLWI